MSGYKHVTRASGGLSSDRKLSSYVGLQRVTSVTVFQIQKIKLHVNFKQLDMHRN